MNNDQCDAVIEMLEDVLDAERAALLGGDLDGMRRLVDRKEKLVEQFATVPDPDLQSVRNLSEKMKRNQGLLTESLKGIKSVSDRLAALHRVQHSLDTYDANGTKCTVQMKANARVEKRA